MYKYFFQVNILVFQYPTLPNKNFFNKKYKFSVLHPWYRLLWIHPSCIRLMHLMSADQVQHREWCPIMGVCGSISLSSFKSRGLDFSTGQVCGHQILLLDAYLDLLRASSSGSCTAEEKRKDKERTCQTLHSKSTSKQKQID